MYRKSLYSHTNWQSATYKELVNGDGGGGGVQKVTVVAHQCARYHLYKGLANNYGSKGGEAYSRFACCL